MNELKGLIHLVSIAAPFRYGIPDMTRPPSAILYVGHTLKKQGFKVTIHHITENEIDACVQEITSSEYPIFVGFSAMTGAQITFSANMGSAIKAHDPRIPIVWGGIHASLMPRETLMIESVDFVVIGEGENTALELAHYLMSGDISAPNNIRGLGYKNSDNTISVNSSRPHEKKLDNFRQDWSLVNLDNYVQKEGDDKIFYFITSRGCPHNCSFCYNQAFNQRRWRSHSVEFVVDELRMIKEKTGITHVIFDDDNFFTDRIRGIEILRQLKKLDIVCRWVDLRVDYISEELIDQLTDLKVKNIFFGFESGCDFTLERISKGFSSKFILEKTKILSKYSDLVIDASAIVGFPWEDKADRQKTVSLALKMFMIKPFKLRFNIGIFVPYPGAPVLDEAKAKGFQFPQKSEDWKSFDILSGTMMLPWLRRSDIRKYTVIDRYAKLLYVSRKRNAWLTALSYFLAGLAFLRLKFKVLAFPFEIWLSDWHFRKRIKK